MSFSSSSLGPQGWALVVILSGALISVPFVRSNTGSRDQQGYYSLVAGLNDSANEWSTRPGGLRQDDYQDSTETELDSPSLPEWARKPSPLDSLIQQSKLESKLSQNSPSLLDRKPAPHKAWTSQPHEACLQIRDDVPDQKLSSNRMMTPFSDSPENGLAAAQSSLAELVWPDVAIGQQLAKSRSSGSILAASSRASDFPVASLESRGRSVDDLPDAGLIDKKEPVAGVERARPIGAQLRRGLAPDDSRFIFQPGTKQ
jgi:hypothetical protein